MRLIYLILFFVCPFCAFAQTDTLLIKQKSLLKQSIVPLSLTTLGAVSWLGGYDSKIHKYRTENYPDFNHKVDDFNQFTPAVAVYLLPVFGLKTKHDVWNKTALIGKSTFVSLATMGSLKYLINKDRPTAAQPAFPSGHTTMAFCSAEIFYQEYKDKYPIVAHSGYLLASTVGVMRVLNNKHWASDVLVGSAIGMFATKLVYATHQNKWGKWFKLKNDKLTIIPNVLNKGVYLSYKL